MWLVRAGEKARWIDDFKTKNIIANSGDTHRGINSAVSHKLFCF